MKKIDLHIHTIKTISDADFVFDLPSLKSYMEFCDLDAVAITNHNVFDEQQYKEISESLPRVVLPGIEINLDGGHLLLYTNPFDTADFAIKCREVQRLIRHDIDSISVGTLQAIYGDLSKYLLIPHYEKSPAVPDEAISQLKSFIFAGEVTSPKKFIYCQKNPGRLTPVYFSDCRASTDLNRNRPMRHTYLSCGEITISAINNALKDKSKVSLSRNEGASLFQVLDDGTEISTGLTVVMGERSSGKSYTLERILKSVENPKYIKQFQLVARDEEQDKARFSELLSSSHSLFSQEYLKEFQIVIADMINVDIVANESKITDYLETLKKNASEVERQDSFSKCILFREEGFSIDDLKGLKALIESVRHLIENIDFRSIIDKHINIASLKALIVELMNEYSRRDEENRKKVWVNEIIHDVKLRLQLRTSATIIKDVDLYRIATDAVKRKKFDQLVSQLRRPRPIMKSELQSYQLIAKIGDFGGAGELLRQSGIKTAFSSAFAVYNKPYQYLQSLKSIPGLAPANIYELFAKIEYKILNKDGAEVSGGERSEFYLLQEIGNAQQHEILLIDEPESSFDNVFLKNEVNKIIKDISGIMPVVLVTHNSTIGASIMPDYVLHTTKKIVGGAPVYSIYSGHPSDKHLKSTSGEEIKNHDATLKCLEAGQAAYIERKGIYENLEN